MTMDLPALHGERLRAFAAVARHNGFSRAARALGQTQSSLSQAVSLLEVELAEKLFVREGREVRLSEAGALYLQHVEAAFAALAQGREAILGLRALTRGRLTLGTTDTLASYVLPRAFGAFRQAYPGLELKLAHSPSPQIAARVHAGELDLGVVSLPLPESMRLGNAAAADLLTTESLMPQRDVLIVGAAHPLSGRVRVSLAALRHEAWVLLDGSTATRALLDSSFEAQGFLPKISMEMGSVEVLKRLVELGFGVSVVPAVAAEREVALGVLRALHVRGLSVQRSIGLVMSRQRPLSRSAQAFVDVARRTLAG
ncbi:MAG: hypothetical protein RL385_5963 [Pseudomonadota bacterium]|jgi:DNA-binding transcriptional LysR family regulator